MPLQHPEPPVEATEAISGKLRAVGPHAGANLSALGGAADPSDLTPTDPHEVYVLDLPDVLGDDPLAGARLTGWRYLLSDQQQVISSAMTVLTDTGEHRFALFNRGPYVAGTVTALRTATDLPEVASQDMRVRLLTVPALNLTAIWLHGEEADLLIPMAPVPKDLTSGQPYPAATVLATLREPAQALTAITPADETGA
ncbi:hypothetical protein [Streptomyces gardneri]|uniref:hypothetical protein n=1 Tax=Streptomyces gardneri TaxID=66892 RepID=UPI0036BBB63A